MDKKPVSSNLQGLDNDKPIPRGQPNETINFDSDRHILTAEHQPTGEISREKSDIYRLQDEDFRSRVQEIASDEHHPTTDNSSNQQCQTNVSEYDPIVHRDSKLGRLHLSIRYNNEQSQLTVQIIDAEGIIRPEQVYAPEMALTFSLIGHDKNTEDNTEKHTRIVVENAAVLWKEPMTFSSTYEKLIQQNLHIFATNETDPSAPRDREAFISLNHLTAHGEEINQWLNLQFVEST